jgi:hypothetical protein
MSRTDQVMSNGSNYRSSKDIRKPCRGSTHML